MRTVKAPSRGGRILREGIDRRKSVSPASWFVRVSLALTLLAFTPRLSAQSPPRLVATPAFNGVRIDLEGTASASYSIERSTNLTGWVTATTNTLAGPKASLVLPTSDVAAFFRARVVVDSAVPGLPQVTVLTYTNAAGPQADLPNRLAIASPDKDLVAQFTGRTGIRYTLTISSNAVVEPIMIRMTELRDLVGVPAQNGFFGGLLIEPSDVVLTSMAMLRIESTNDLPARDIIAYGFQPDGRDWHLLLANTDTNAVEFLIPSLGGFGFGAVTDAELAALPEPSPTAAAAARRPSLAGILEDSCYPEERARAGQVRYGLGVLLSNYLEVKNKQIAQDRRNQNLPPRGPLTANQLQQLTESLSYHYKEWFQPHLPEAGDSCAISEARLNTLQLLSDYATRMGVAPLPWKDEAAEYACKAVKRCKQQALDCCIAGGTVTSLRRSFAAADRLGGSFGVDPKFCPSLSLADVGDKCAPLWSGKLEYTGSTRDFYQNNPPLEEHQDETELTCKLTGEIISASEQQLFWYATVTLQILVTDYQASAYRRADDETHYGACKGGSRASLSSLDGSRPLARPLDGYLADMISHKAASGVLKTNWIITLKINVEPLVTIPIIPPLDVNQLMLQNEAHLREIKLPGVTIDGGGHWESRQETDHGCEFATGNPEIHDSLRAPDPFGKSIIGQISTNSCTLEMSSHTQSGNQLLHGVISSESTARIRLEAHRR